ncbi:MAG: hypothetical protein Q8M16_11510 [Pirellulaceae bacterium]|nr:hypothetical protein [Pirellulaceae bacterium]
MNVQRPPPFVRFRNVGGIQVPVENDNQPARNVEQRFVEPVLPGVGVQLQALPTYKRPATVGKPIPQIVRQVAPQRNVGTLARFFVFRFDRQPTRRRFQMNVANANRSEFGFPQTGHQQRFVNQRPLQSQQFEFGNLVRCFPQCGPTAFERFPQRRKR